MYFSAARELQIIMQKYRLPQKKRFWPRLPRTLINEKQYRTPCSTLFIYPCSLLVFEPHAVQLLHIDTIVICKEVSKWYPGDALANGFGCASSTMKGRPFCHAASKRIPLQCVERHIWQIVSWGDCEKASNKTPLRHTEEGVCAWIMTIWEASFSWS